MGYSQEEILYFESQKQRSPVIEMISNYESQGKTISELISLLEEMERNDLIEDLQNYIGKRRKVLVDIAFHTSLFFEYPEKRVDLAGGILKIPINICRNRLRRITMQTCIFILLIKLFVSQCFSCLL